MRRVDNCDAEGLDVLQHPRYPSPPCCAEDGDSRVSVELNSSNIDDTGLINNDDTFSHIQGTSNYKRLKRKLIRKSYSDEDEENFIRERQEIVIKRLHGEEVSPSEFKKHAYLEWLLDRIDDAKYGVNLDELETAINSNYALAEAIHDFSRKIENVRQKNPRKRR